ncbi:MAG: hypothetical protein RR806_07505 [Oscillospiraceae bacterium]
MSNIKQRTLKSWAHNAKSEVDEILEQNPNMREVGVFENGFYSRKNKDKKKLIIFAWRWNGEWADSSKEVFTRLIEA